ncbi:MAG TPA: sigma-70 family RNA polymerase sigma factor [Caulifigura sp.]|jgi:RNA polymerase sigma-70 factor (ECF subfamily)|nr:sigma-70 family RNA polymerase sigma factor [Caulifigura sp.]
MLGHEPHSVEPGHAAADGSQFIRLFMAHERQLRAYLYQLLPGRDDVDEVMQNASLVLWKKFSELDDESRFLKWAYVVLQYEVLMYRRGKARDRLILNDELLLTLSREVIEDAESLRGSCTALRSCLDALVEQDRKLVLLAYGHGLKVSQLAGQLNRSVQSLYRDLSRLRQRLMRCVQWRLENAGCEPT